MPILLGLDTGGTYTDAVLFDQAKGAAGGGDAAQLHGGVLATAKSLTTKHDLSIGLKGAIEAVLPRLPAGVKPADIALVSMSTTLATNAIVEGHGAPICLILLGYGDYTLYESRLNELVEHGTHFVRWGSVGDDNIGATVGSDNIGAGLQAGEHLLARGRRRIAYERLLLDVIHGDATLFVRRDEVEEAWRWVDGVADTVCIYSGGELPVSAQAAIIDALS